MTRRHKAGNKQTIFAVTTGLALSVVIFFGFLRLFVDSPSPATLKAPEVVGVQAASPDKAPRPLTKHPSNANQSDSSHLMKRVVACAEHSGSRPALNDCVKKATLASEVVSAQEDIALGQLIMAVKAAKSNPELPAELEARRQEILADPVLAKEFEASVAGLQQAWQGPKSQ